MLRLTLQPADSATIADVGATARKVGNISSCLKWFRAVRFPR